MRILTTGLICVVAFNAQANVFQYFSGLNYNNPSELFKVKNTDMIIGGTWSYADLKFSGSSLNFNTGLYESGVNHSRTSMLMPYGRIAKRINPKTVFSVDVTEPFNSNIDWGSVAFTRYAAQQNYLYDVDISPKIAYSFSPKFHVGAGVNFNFLKNNVVSWAMPTGPLSYGSLVNSTSGFGVGYNLGLTYAINQTNFLGLTYYSIIRQDTTGTSTLDANVSTNLIFNFKMPATTILDYVHIFNPSWLINLEVIQSEWDANQYANFYNTAAQPPFNNFSFTMHFKKSYAYLAALRKQWNEKLGLTLIGVVDTGPERDNLRTIVFPSYVQYFVGLMGDYHFNKTTSIELLYGHDISNPGIHNQVMINSTTSIPFTTGKVNINADVIDLKLKIQA